MKSMKKILNTCLVLSILLVSSCADITDINENPNGVDPNTVDPNFILSTVMTNAGKDVARKGYGDPLAAYVQHIQKDSWSSNEYSDKGDCNIGRMSEFWQNHTRIPSRRPFCERLSRTR